MRDADDIPKGKTVNTKKLCEIRATIPSKATEGGLMTLKTLDMAGGIHLQVKR